VQWHKLRLKVVLAALLATLIVLFGGQWLYTKYSLQQPLKEILADDGIRYYRIEEEPVLRVYVRLNHPRENRIDPGQPPLPVNRRRQAQPGLREGLLSEPVCHSYCHSPG